MFIPNANMHNSGELYVIRRTGWVHLRSGRIAVALSVNFGISIAFRNRHLRYSTGRCHDRKVVVLGPASFPSYST